jgi:predicted transcriptional regulator
MITQNKKYFELQKSAQLSNTQAAEYLGVNISTIKRYRNGKLTTPKAVLMSMEFYISKQLTKEFK